MTTVDPVLKPFDDLSTCYIHNRPWVYASDTLPQHPAGARVCWQVKVFAGMFQRATEGRSPAEITSWLKDLLGVDKWSDLTPGQQIDHVYEMVDRGW